jgi:hypothetical protein
MKLFKTIYVGWSGHPVCAKRYHFIIKNESRAFPSCRTASCVHCGAKMSVTESRCSICARKFLYFESVFLQVLFGNFVCSTDLVNFPTYSGMDRSMVMKVDGVGP